MHQFLQAIGFGNLKNRREWKEMLDLITEFPTRKDSFVREDGSIYVCMCKDVAPNMGISVCGEEDQDGEFHLDYYFPYYKSGVVTAVEEIVINKRIDTEAFTGMCEDMRLGVSLIFYLQNDMEYRQYQDVLRNGSFVAPLELSGLSLQGKILLGVETKEEHRQNRIQETNRRTSLIAEARKGNQEAIDSLTIDDIDLFASVSRRARQEDLYSIVETAFIPFGSESDNYSVIGTILHCHLHVNAMTGEKVWSMKLRCNDMEFGIAIREDDLYGEPKPGRRFKGNLWMQGRVAFSN